MRYFETSNATRPYKVGGLAFEFEPIELRGGGSWLGVLAAEEPAASILASAPFPQVKEISLEDFEALKKKIEGTVGASSVKAAPDPAGSCHSCGQNGYQVRR